MFKVITLKEMDQVGHEILTKAGCEVYTSKGETEEEFLKEIKDLAVDAIFVRTDKITPAMMDASPNLKCIAKQGVGLDNIDLDYATKKGIQVVFSAGGNSNAVAEHTILLMLMCAVRYRHVDHELRDNKNFDVRYTLENTYELKGKTLGLLGCGRIGQMVAAIAHNGFGMNIIGYDPFPPKSPIVPIEMMEKDEVLKNADFVSLHMPSLPTTKHSIGYDDFCKMKPTAIFVNCARGDVIVEEDLVRVLKEGKILGAGLDVFDQEPFSFDNPLINMENAIITPHTAATTHQSVINCTTMACECLLEVINGKPVSNPACCGNKLDKQFRTICSLT